MTAEGLEDLFRPVGRVLVKRFFGGRGILLDGVTFAFELRGEIYLRADESGAAALAAVGSRQFSYDRAGREVLVGFWTLPEAAHEDSDELLRWALPALEYARRKAAAKLKKSAKPMPTRTKLRRRSQASH